MVSRVLAPIDGSDCSERALLFAAEFCHRFEADLDVVHITDIKTEATDTVMDRANQILAETEIEADPTISIDLGLTFKASDRIGRDILDIVEEESYDHVVMGHHGAGAVDRFILGSAAETVLRSGDVGVTAIP